MTHEGIVIVCVFSEVQQDPIMSDIKQSIENVVWKKKYVYPVNIIINLMEIYFWFCNLHQHLQKWKKFYLQKRSDYYPDTRAGWSYTDSDCLAFFQYVWWFNIECVRCVTTRERQQTTFSNME